MFYSTKSSLDRKPSLSSDEDGDIYCPSLGPSGSRGDIHQMETTDRQVDQDPQERDTLKPDQVRPEETHQTS